MCIIKVFSSIVPGVPMQCAAAGVACGLVVRTHSDSDEIQEYKILTDLNVMCIDMHDIV